MQETRQAIVNILKERGQTTAAQLSQELQLTLATIRHHLDILRGEGLIEMSRPQRRRSPGRPQHVYILTERANDLFPQNYAEFADLTLREVREHVGLAELESIVQGVARRMAADVPHPQPDEPLPRRLDRVVDFLNRKGYLARWERTEQGCVLRAAHCPYQALIGQHHEPCIIDQTLMADLLGVKPQRVDWIALGDAACTYLVPEPDNRPLP